MAQQNGSEILWMKPSNYARRWQTKRCKCTALCTSPHRFRLHAVNQMLQQLLQQLQRGSWSALQIYNVPRWTRPHHQRLQVRLTFWIYQCHFNLSSHSNDPSSTMQGSMNWEHVLRGARQQQESLCLPRHIYTMPRSLQCAKSSRYCLTRRRIFPKMCMHLNAYHINVCVCSIRFTVCMYVCTVVLRIVGTGY